MPDGVARIGTAPGPEARAIFAGPDESCSNDEPERLQLGLGTLEQVLGVHVGIANGAILTHFRKSLDQLQLTQKQAAVLWLADEYPGVSQIDLARLFRVDRATMLGVTNLLVRRGLIARRPDASDRRRVGLHVTGKGAEVLARARVAVAAHERWVKAALTRREFATLTRLLKRIYLREGEAE